MISPGRANLLVEHVDYNSGVILPTVINRYVTMIIKQHSDDWVILLQLTLMLSLNYH